MKILPNHRNLHQNILPHLRHFTEEEQREDSGGGAERGEGHATVGLKHSQCGFGRRLDREDGGGRKDVLFHKLSN
jgi:hypothetical protein